MTARLTPRQTEIMDWVCQGKTAEDVAVILGISANAVRDSLKLVKARLDAVNLPHAAVLFDRGRRP